MRAVLPPDELKRRIDAFRTLKGLRQVDLAELLVADGFGKQDVGRLERGDVPLTRARRRSLAEHLGVPERWLVDEELDLSEYHGEEDTGDLEARLAGIQRAIMDRSRHDLQVDRLLEQQNELLARQAEILSRIEALLSPAEDPAPAESAGFSVPAVPQQLREALNPQRATERPAADTPPKRDSEAQGA
jgi:transcriptional regulator with XRE-family HTH domain